ncbi:hydroxypyruvate isomerase family protein [Frigidibacter sp. ROC022]|uniref:hydroxypyruvate isomerase family protein n=1 Tax=Frigidibacter sp. ROC022 TaxID=2971796 RepID=UPI00215AB1CD|nr:TIM barrel protein [Frigidibacter sp. ROC022]MCR8724567.1 TIM barrel protein [Frigidibacter sp. ROC022]
MTLPFSANLGFLWTDLALPEAVRAAARAGFDAVELHWPYAVAPAQLRQALDDSGLPVLGLNTSRGDVERGQFGLSALPGQEAAARAAIDQALAYAREIGASSLHVMAGKAEGTAARDTFIANLRHAAEAARDAAITILLEPLNHHDVPGYFLVDNATAAAIIEATGQDNIRIMFDCYHVGRSGRSILDEFATHREMIGHVQFAALPDRGEPDQGDVDYARVLPALAEAGYGGFFGAEYKPRQGTDEGLGWLTAWRQLPEFNR